MAIKAGMYIDGDCLIVPIQTELRKEDIALLQGGILENVREKRLKGVVIDLAGVSLLDTYQARKIFAIGQMAKLLGAVTVFTGLSTGIVVSLIDFGFESFDVNTAISLEDGIKLLKEISSSSIIVYDDGEESQKKDGNKKEANSEGSNPN